MKLLIPFQLFFLTVSLLLLGTTHGTVDLTLVAGSKGEEVVEASIQKLDAIPGLFSNDYGFLKRIALVESNFGNDSAVIAANPNGGIWQITKDIDSDLLTNSASTAIVNAASQYIGVKATSLASSNYSLPMKSVFGARLFIDLIRGSDSMPTTLQEQADWWVTYYHPGGSSSSFIALVQGHENKTSCTTRKLDLWFLLDGSGSIGQGNFDESLEFVAKTSDSFNISENQVRTGLMIYSSTTYPISNFNEHLTNEEFKQEVLSTVYPGGGTRTGQAIAVVSSDGFNTANGARPTSEGVPRVLIVLTDGHSGDDVGPPSEQIKESVIVYAVGVGSSYNQEELEAIANTPSSDYVFEIARFADLVEVVTRSLQQEACDFPITLQNDSSVNVNVNPGDTSYTQVQMPANGSVVLNFNISIDTSGGVVYISGTVSKPSAVINDIAITLTGGALQIVLNDGQDDLLSVSLASVTTRERSRKRRNAEDTQPTRPLYIAIKSTGQKPLDLALTASTSPSRAPVADVQIDDPSTEQAPVFTGGASHAAFGANAMVNAVLIVGLWMLSW